MSNEQLFDKENPDFYDKREREKGITTEEDYFEETAAEVTPNMGVLGQGTLLAPENERIKSSEKNRDLTESKGAEGGTGMGMFALILSILSLFVMPIILGAAGIIVGFMARRRGAEGIGAWAIGIGVVSIAINLFVLPFF